MGVGIPGVFKEVVSQICIHKTLLKLSCGTSAVGLYVPHVLSSFGKVDTSGQTVRRIFMKIGEGVLYKLVVAQE